jgi:hypothetical protein
MTLSEKELWLAKNRIKKMRAAKPAMAHHDFAIYLLRKADKTTFRICVLKGEHYGCSKTQRSRIGAAQ